MTSREQFEVWARHNHMDLYINGVGNYATTTTYRAWIGWQACTTLVAVSEYERGVRDARDIALRHRSEWIGKTDMQGCATLGITYRCRDIQPPPITPSVAG